MASFSRGPVMLFKLPMAPSSRVCAQCLRQARRFRPPSSPIQIHLPRRSITSSRILSQSLKPRLRSKPIQNVSEEVLGDYASKLNLSLTAPTVIYEAPSHRTLIIAACGLSLFFAGYGIIQALQPGMTFIFGAPPSRDSDKISWIIPPILMFVGGVLVGIGVWSYGAVRNLVKRITIVPMGGKGEMQARLEVSRLAPWRVHTLELPLSSLALGRRMQDVAPSAETLEKRYRDPKDAGVLLRPFLRMGKGMRTFFDETRNVFWRVPFVTLDTGGQGKFTLDARGSAYKGSVGLDRLIRTDYEKGKFWEALG